TALCGAGIIAFEQGDLPTALARLEASAVWGRQAKTPHSTALLDYGLCLLVLGTAPEQVRVIFDEALARDREMGDERGVGWCLYFLGYLAGYIGDYTRAQELNDAAIQRFRQVGDAWSLSQAIGYLGPLLLIQKDLRRARPVLEEWLELARRLGN